MTAAVALDDSLFRGRQIKVRKEWCVDDLFSRGIFFPLL